METLKLDISKTGVAVSAAMQAKAQAANALLESGKGAGSDFLGWVHLPSSITPDRSRSASRSRGREAAARSAEVIICIGIGGSLSGRQGRCARPWAIRSSCAASRSERNPSWCSQARIISEDYTHELLEAVKEYSIATIVISKSGTTTEPAIAFRLDQSRDRKALRQGRRPPSASWPSPTSARGALEDARRQRGLRRPSSFPTTWAAGSRC